MLSKKLTQLISLCCLSMLLTVSSTAYAASSNHSKSPQIFATSPSLNHGQRWRIGYMQGGDYGSYQSSLRAIINGLTKLGWIKAATLPELPDNKDTYQLWHWLATQAQSDYLEFISDAWYDCNWDKQLRSEVSQQVIERLNSSQDIDLMLAFGTWAGQDLATNKLHTPVLVASTTDPIAAGIIKSVSDSGYDHIIAKVDPERHKRQVRLFKDIFDFNTLGIVYEDSVEGRSFAAIDSVEEVAQEMGFKIAVCNAQFDDISQEQAVENVVKCYKKLAAKVDAIYITRHPGVTIDSLAQILAPALAAKKPTFSQGMSDEVAHGVLMSISLADFSYIGDFYAQTIAQIFNGAKPRQLEQHFQNPPKIALNLKTAQIIGYDPSVDILGATDEIFTAIKTPTK
ncbi:MAG: ABC transporter substrate binding protein [Desulfuromonas sp.]|nr:ABC transporter substrate binding protein [Desulfuromonas sp.]